MRVFMREIATERVQARINGVTTDVDTRSTTKPAARSAAHRPVYEMELRRYAAAVDLPVHALNDKEAFLIDLVS